MDNPSFAVAKLLPLATFEFAICANPAATTGILWKASAKLGEGTIVEQTAVSKKEAKRLACTALLEKLEKGELKPLVTIPEEKASRAPKVTSVNKLHVAEDADLIKRGAIRIASGKVAWTKCLEDFVDSSEDEDASSKHIGTE